MGRIGKRVVRLHGFPIWINCYRNSGSVTLTKNGKIKYLDKSWDREDVAGIFQNGFCENRNTQTNCPWGVTLQSDNFICTTREHFITIYRLFAKLNMIFYSYLCTTCVWIWLQFSVSASVPAAGLRSLSRTPATLTPDQTGTVNMNRYLEGRNQ